MIVDSNKRNNITSSTSTSSRKQLVIVIMVATCFLSFIGLTEAWMTPSAMTTQRSVLRRMTTATTRPPSFPSLLTPSSINTRLGYKNENGEDNHHQQQHQKQQEQQHQQQQDEAGGNKEGAVERQASVERVGIVGVSVSPKGFHILLQTPTSGILPLAITNSPQDSVRTTTPESLTIMQLLNGIDMAGPILPPELLAKLAVEYCESITTTTTTTSTTAAAAAASKSSIQQLIVEYVQQNIPKDCPTTTFTDSSMYYKNRIGLPQITLDQLTVTITDDGDDDGGDTNIQCLLECAVPKTILQPNNNNNNNNKKNNQISTSLTIPITSKLIETNSYQYEPDVSLLFTSIALALRYKAPIVLRTSTSNKNNNNHDNNDNSKFMYYRTRDELVKDFPSYLGLDAIQEQNNRITTNIEQSYKIHQLTSALQIAIKLNDQKAVEKIRSKLDEYDSMDGLPTTTAAITTTTGSTTTKSETSSSTSTIINSISMTNSTSSSSSLDDLDQNILQ